MPEDDFDTPDHDEESPVIRDLRRKAKRADDAEAKVTQLETELAISRAKLDLTPAKQKALLAAHEGDMTEESLRKTAIDLGFATEQAEPEAEPQVPAEEVEAHERAQAATAGAEPSDAHPTKLDDLIAGAKSEAELEQILSNAGIGVNASE